MIAISNYSVLLPIAEPPEDQVFADHWSCAGLKYFDLYYVDPVILGAPELQCVEPCEPECVGP